MTSALKKYTLTNFWVARGCTQPAAVAAAYGWSADISNDEVLRELLALNGGGQ